MEITVDTTNRKSALMNIYDRLPVTFESGKGVWLFDSSNKKYLDANCGIGVTSLGHAHPAVLQAINEQAKKIIHIGNSYIIEEQEQLGYEFCEFVQLDQVIFVNSGTEATEVSLKMARLYGHHRGIENPTLIVFEKGFHGRTMGSLSASGNFKLQEGFSPLLPGFIFAPYNDLKAIEKIAAQNKNIVGISLEPILGQGGVVVPNDNFLLELRKICDQQKWLLILDEIQTGLGRTGKNFAYQHYDLKPDIITVAKSLAQGIPIGVCAAVQEVADLMQYGKHGTTFGGNPFSCHVARAVIKIYREEGIVEHVKRMGEYLLMNLRERLSSHPGVKDIRGKGLMIGIELDKPCHKLLFHGLEEGLLFNVTANNVVRMLPPYILTEVEADMIVDKFRACLNSFYEAKQ